MIKFVFLFFAIGLVVAQPLLKGVQTKSVQTLSTRPITYQAIAMSALMPGLGQLYVGQQSKARWMMGADLGLWLGWAWLGTLQKERLQLAHSYAERYASQGSLAYDEKLLQSMGSWRSRSGVAGEVFNPDLGENYDLDQQRSAQASQLPMGSNYSWDWGSSEDPVAAQRFVEYQQMLSEWRGFKISGQAIVGGLLLGRVVSVVDLVVFKRRENGLTWSGGLGLYGPQMSWKGEF